MQAHAYAVSKWRDFSTKQYIIDYSAVLVERESE